MKTNLSIPWKRTLDSVLLLALAGCGSSREHNFSLPPTPAFDYKCFHEHVGN
jgi:hypothetical protein